jgi:hypothetical protein
VHEDTSVTSLSRPRAYTARISCKAPNLAPNLDLYADQPLIRVSPPRHLLKWWDPWFLRIRPRKHEIWKTWEHLGNCGISCMRGCQGATQIANVLSFSSRRAAIKDIVSLTSSFIWFICHKYAISYHGTAPRLQSTPAFQHINFIQLQDFPKHLRYLEILKPEPDITRRCDKWLVQKWQCRW